MTKLLEEDNSLTASQPHTVANCDWSALDMEALRTQVCAYTDSNVTDAFRDWQEVPGRQKGVRVNEASN
jgi:hypothetical protein